MKSITKEEIEQKLNEKQTFLIQYSASWCGPCRVLTPILENVCDSESVDIFKFDISTDPEYAKTKKIMSIPYVEFIKNGKLVAHKVGSAPREFYEEQLKEVLLS